MFLNTEFVIFNKSKNLSGSDNDDLFLETVYSGCIEVEFIIACLICLSNIILFFTIITAPIMRTVANVYVANLAFSDFCVGLQIIVKCVGTVVITSPCSKIIVCLFKIFGQLVSSMASVLTLFVVGLERYMFCFHPRQHVRLLRNRVNAATVTGIWLCSLSFTFPLFARKSTAWMLPCSIGSKLSPECSACRALLNLYLIPVVGVCIIYPTMAFRLWRVRRKIAPIDGHPPAPRSQTDTPAQLGQAVPGDMGNEPSRRTILKVNKSSVNDPSSIINSDKKRNTKDKDNRAHKRQRSNKRPVDPSLCSIDEGTTVYDKNPISEIQPDNNRANTSPTQPTTQPEYTYELQSGGRNRQKKVTFSCEQFQQTEWTSVLNKKEIRLIKTLILIVLYTMVSWIPMLVFSAYGHSMKSDWIRCFVHVLMYSNSFFNTIFFYCLCRHFRIAISNLLKCKCRKISCRKTELRNGDDAL